MSKGLYSSDKTVYGQPVNIDQYPMSFDLICPTIQSIGTAWACVLIKFSGELTIFTQAMSGIGLALLAVFVPLAIALFQQGGDTDYEYIDRAVKRDWVLGIPTFLLKAGLLFVPLLFWDFAGPTLRLLLVLVWLIGVCVVIQTLIFSYNWLRDGGAAYRLEYLKRGEKNPNLEGLWGAVWRAAGRDNMTDGDYLKVFIVMVDRLIGLPDGSISSNRHVAVRLLRDFRQLFLKRPAIYLSAPSDAFEQVLLWHFGAWVKEIRCLLREDNHEDWFGWRELSQALDELIRAMVDRSLVEGSFYGVLELLKQHVAHYRLQTVGTGKEERFYLQSLFGVFYPRFFAGVGDSKEEYDIWQHYFPRDWLITSASLEGEENLAVRVTLNEFFQWAQTRIRLGNKEWDADLALDEIARGLFPETDPMTWAVLFTLAVRPWTNNRRMASLIDYPPTFGLVGRMRVFMGSEEVAGAFDALQVGEIREALLLAIKLFPGTFTATQLQLFQVELADLEYSDDKNKEARRLSLIETLNQLQQLQRELLTPASPTARATN